MSNEIENIISHIQPFEDSLKVNEYIEEFKRENEYLKTMNEELKNQKAELIEYLTYLYTSQLIKSQRLTDILNKYK